MIAIRGAIRALDGNSEAEGDGPSTPLALGIGTEAELTNTAGHPKLRHQLPQLKTLLSWRVPDRQANNCEGLSDIRLCRGEIASRP